MCLFSKRNELRCEVCLYSKHDEMRCEVFLYNRFSISGTQLFLNLPSCRYSSRDNLLSIDTNHVPERHLSLSSEIPNGDAGLESESSNSLSTG